jgi:hypothetical protein
MEKKVDDRKLNDLINSIKVDDKIFPVKLEKCVSYLNFWCLNDLEKSLNYNENQIFAKLKDENDGALELMQYCAFFNTANIPIGFLNEALSLKLVSIQEINLNKIINKLEKLTLVSSECQNNEACIRLHDFIVEKLKGFLENGSDNDKIGLDLVKTLNKLFELVGKDDKSLIKNEIYYKLALNLCNNLDYSILMII